MAVEKLAGLGFEFLAFWPAYGATWPRSLTSEPFGVTRLYIGCCGRRSCGERRSSEALQASGFWWAGTPGSRWRGNPGLWKSSPTGNVRIEGGFRAMCVE